MTTIDGDVLTGWHPICPVDRLLPDRGVAALVEGVPVAVFLLRTGELFALDNLDPCSGANVMSRGLIGDAGGVPTVASPMFKQRFDLLTGQCLDDPDRRVTVHHARIVDDVIEVALGAPGGPS
jgi:nitrite reductase (NADH) small subunit